jgi:hypothetical protein
VYVIIFLKSILSHSFIGSYIDYSMSEDKIRDIIDRVNRGEIGLASVEVTTSRIDGGRISSTMKKKCGPCNIGNHGECEGDLVCDCDHTSHHQRQSRQRAH